jgi:hypothetical protein
MDLEIQPHTGVEGATLQRRPGVGRPAAARCAGLTCVHGCHLLTPSLRRVSPITTGVPVALRWKRPLTQGLRPLQRCLTPARARPRAAILAAGHGRPEAKDLQVPSRQPAGDAQAEPARARRVPAVPPAEAPASRLPDLRHLSRPRGRAARDARPLVHAACSRRRRRDGRRSRPRRDRRRRPRSPLRPRGARPLRNHRPRFPARGIPRCRPCADSRRAIYCRAQWLLADSMAA